MPIASAAAMFQVGPWFLQCFHMCGSAAARYAAPAEKIARPPHCGGSIRSIVCVRARRRNANRIRSSDVSGRSVGYSVFSHVWQCNDGSGSTGGKNHTTPTLQRVRQADRLCEGEASKRQSHPQVRCFRSVRGIVSVSTCLAAPWRGTQHRRKKSHDTHTAARVPGRRNG